MSYSDGNSPDYIRFQVDSMLANALPVYTFDPSLGVLNQLTSTDKLTLIQSEALNNKLSNWNSMIQDYKEDEDMYNSYNPVGLEILMEGREFENHLSSVISWLSLINTQSEGVLNYIDSILEIIESELNSD